MNGVGGYAGWRWIFILEGLLTIVVAVVAFFVQEAIARKTCVGVDIFTSVYDFPDTASFLTIEEKAWVTNVSIIYLC